MQCAAMASFQPDTALPIFLDYHLSSSTSCDLKCLEGILFSYIATQTIGAQSESGVLRPSCNDGISPRGIMYHIDMLSDIMI
jgi:hypothetical protein